jgi:DNA-binding CsgD family transcriptional regulator
MNKKIKTEIPEFKSLDEEREYWEARGPLAEGQGGRINRPKPGQKRSSFLSIRLTGEELTQLRDMAAKFGVGPSTYVRQVLKLAVEQKSWPSFLPPSFSLKPLYISTNTVQGANADLSPREREVLQLVAQGATDKKIADSLFISENAVKTHLRSIIKKLHLPNRSQATMRATEPFDESIELAEKAYIAYLETRNEMLEKVLRALQETGLRMGVRMKELEREPLFTNP